MKNIHTNKQTNKKKKKKKKKNTNKEKIFACILLKNKL